MKNMNNKGFTLVELIATVVLLVLVMGIGAYSITAIIEKSKEKDYNLLIENIKNASEDYYIECQYGDVDLDIIDCDGSIKLGDLVNYGYLTGNGKDSDDKYTLVNPNNKNSIVDCTIEINYDDGKVIVTSLGQNETNSCPSSY